MDARDLLRSLTGRGFIVATTARGTVRVSPASALTEADREALARHKAEVLALLQRVDGPAKPGADSGRGRGDSWDGSWENAAILRILSHKPILHAKN